MLLPQATLTPHLNSKRSEQAAITGTLPFVDGCLVLYYYTSKTDDIPIRYMENRRELNGTSSQFKDINRKEANSPIHKSLQKSYKYHAIYHMKSLNIVWNYYSNCNNSGILLFPNHVQSRSNLQMKIMQFTSGRDGAYRAGDVSYLQTY